ncbi:unnamed protein product [Acanthoscelides obtectus]|uniref:Uncharacterized protein n=1 Tax=Acanthoscelides obtectus TaxID=200917 RepID=A0A9P0PGH8_ACAOB|nr:unnamed protein product [Acanthoscelides obtectus]CAK1677491.1 hypothetical protein AOBTE_LOCUS31365 [Acanthoscelides obtectus]
MTAFCISTSYNLKQVLTLTHMFYHLMSGKSGRSCSPAPTYFAFPANSKLDLSKCSSIVTPRSSK